MKKCLGKSTPASDGAKKMKRSTSSVRKPTDSAKSKSSSDSKQLQIKSMFRKMFQKSKKHGLAAEGALTQDDDSMPTDDEEEKDDTRASTSARHVSVPVVAEASAASEQEVKPSVAKADAKPADYEMKKASLSSKSKNFS